MPLRCLLSVIASIVWKYEDVPRVDDSPVVVPFSELPLFASHISHAHAVILTGDLANFESFEEDILVLGSLQQPKRIIIRGSDGNR